ncbi:hypothetical protein Y1Q_0023995 [Alligator mississippiensis]|uniref:DNA2/NAM7 helicase-like C-terminal domain-containing protein n=1 Tax=Alligator mississippiensis TaxID=8496 RepID=A0A151NW13_ALLMI|nr:hypothetical protein Y1Q_0023995 [Alligator mississippiensis]
MLAYERAALAKKLETYKRDVAELAELTFQEELRVLQHSRVTGMTTTESSVLFIQHTGAETHDNQSKSYSSKFEACFLASLSRYLLEQGYPGSAITITITTLSPCHRQVMKTHTLMKSRDMRKVAVHAVDDFQGEENDILLLLLVGFLQDKNRLCVAFSWASKGFYRIGNLVCISAGSTSQPWANILRLLQDKNLGGDGRADAQCQNHPETLTGVKSSADFSRVPDGHCTLRCAVHLPRGHPCTRHCHPRDQDRCQLPCARLLSEHNHPCPGTCPETCLPCAKEVEKVIPTCGHWQMVPCSVPASEWVCQVPCEQLPKCEHPCTLHCGSPASA